MSRWKTIIVIALMAVLSSSFIRHWCGGLRFDRFEARVEAQAGEVAFSFWLDHEQYDVNTPLFWAKPIDPRTQLIDACSITFAGLGGRFTPGTKKWSGGVWSGGVVAPWWFYLFATLICLNLRQLILGSVKWFKALYSLRGKSITHKRTEPNTMPNVIHRDT